MKGALAALACTVSICAYAIADTPRRIDVPPGELATALELVSKKTGVELVFNPRQLRGIHTQGVNGILSSQDAVRKLLEGTKLELRTDSATGAMMIGPPQAVTHASAPGHATDPEPQEAGKNSSQDFRVAQVDQESSARDIPLSNSSTKQTGIVPLQEIVVTAQKREERLQDVPVPVTAIEGTELLDRNDSRFEDYFSSIPGLSISPGDEHGSPQLAIRGITTGGFTTPTVGVVIDDVPFGGAGINYGFDAPDLDPSDVARVEVLRGPQGTLYGDSSMGGLIKYVTVAPSTDALTGRMQAGLDTISHGDHVGYNVRGSVNAPLSDTVALRASGFGRVDPGYIDNIVNGQHDVNKGTTYGARLSLLWSPSSDTALRLNALYQHLRVDGSPDISVGPGIGDLQQSDIPNTGWRENKIQAYSANLTAKFGGVSLTSVTGYSVNTDADNYDFQSPFYTSEAQMSFGVSGTPLPETVRTNQFTQELRFTGSLGAHFDWLVGGFYDHVSSALVEAVLAAEPATGALIGNLGSFYLNQPAQVYRESAGFLALTWKITEQFDVQVGGRESFNHFAPTPTVVTGILGGAFCGALPCVFPRGTDSRDNAFTYLFTPRLKLSPDVMIYARLASGYRPGGSNSPPTPLLTYSPDTTRNYELGVKADALDHLLTFDTSVFYIDWRQVQIQLRDPLTNGVYTGNGGKAKSEGVELSVQARPYKGLTLSSWVTYDDAAVTNISTNTSAAISVGDRLPNSSRWSGYFAIQDDFPLTDRISAFVGADESYVGNRIGIFQDTPARQYYPSYAKTDLHAGATYESWKLNLFVNNLTDRRGLLSGGLGSLNPAAFYVIQPRTIGLSVVRSF